MEDDYGPQLRGGLLGMGFTYLTCTLVTLATRQLVRDATYNVAITTTVRTINFVSWSIILFFMSFDIPVSYTLLLMVLQVLVAIIGFNEASFSPCAVYNEYLERKLNVNQTVLLLILQFLTAPVAIFLADFCLNVFYTKSHVWDGWMMTCDNGPVTFLNVPLYQAFFIEMLGSGLISATFYYTDNKLIILSLILLQVLILNVFFAPLTGFFINPLIAAVFLHLYSKGWSYLELVIVYGLAPMLGTWIAVEQFGKRIKKEKPKLF